MTRIYTAYLKGLQGISVPVEVSLSNGLPGMIIIGLTEAATREVKVRVQSAITNSGFLFPNARIAVDLRGASKLDGSGFDLPIALALLITSGQVKEPDEDLLIFGELGLNGDVRPVRGAFSLAEAAQGRILCAFENAREAQVASAFQVLGNKDLRNLVANLRKRGFQALIQNIKAPPSPDHTYDLSDVKGQKAAKRALEIAAVGNHSILLIGAMGAGRTMLARRMTGILPEMTLAEKKEVSRVHSAAGLNVGGGLINERPFRAPHHSTTAPGLVGGGTYQPRPGELALAHNGVLFLDDIPEFARQTLEIIAQPLRDKRIDLMRASGTITYPANALVIASAAKCGCGYNACRCSPRTLSYHQERLRNIAKMFEIKVLMEPVSLTDLEDMPSGEKSEVVKGRVEQARETLMRLAAFENPSYLARVSRTIAVMAESDQIETEHYNEAMSLTVLE